MLTIMVYLMIGWILYEMYVYDKEAFEMNGGTADDNR